MHQVMLSDFGVILFFVALLMIPDFAELLRLHGTPELQPILIEPLAKQRLRDVSPDPEPTRVIKTFGES